MQSQEDKSQLSITHLSSSIQSVDVAFAYSSSAIPYDPHVGNAGELEPTVLVIETFKICEYLIRHPMSPPE